MKKSYLGIGIVVAIIVILVITIMSSYNGFVNVRRKCGSILCTN